VAQTDIDVRMRCIVDNRGGRRVTHSRPGRPPRSDYITLADAAAAIGVSTRTVERMMTDGKLGFRPTPGGYRRLYRTSVEEYCRRYVDNPDDRV
jgi:excisionase family DNA binding protein